MISAIALCSCSDAASLPRIGASAIELVALHNPLLRQIEESFSGGYQVEYLKRDTAWRLAITPA